MWHEPADPARPLTGRYRVISGQHMLNASSSHFDPEATLLDREHLPMVNGFLMGLALVPAVASG
jgi:hypothetical protein